MYRNNIYIEYQLRLILKVCVRLFNVWEVRLYCILEIRNIIDVCIKQVFCYLFNDDFVFVFRLQIGQLDLILWYSYIEILRF